MTPQISSILLIVCAVLYSKSTTLSLTEKEKTQGSLPQTRSNSSRYDTPFFNKGSHQRQTVLTNSTAQKRDRNISFAEKDKKQGALLQVKTNSSKYESPFRIIGGKNHQTTLKNKTEEEREKPRYCIYRYESADGYLTGTNKTKEQLETEGITIFDQICEGDLDLNGDKISSGALASIVG